MRRRSSPPPPWTERSAWDAGPVARRVPMWAAHRGSVEAGLADLGGRAVSLFRIHADTRRGSLSEQDGAVIVAAAQRALDSRVPLVGILASSGADIVEGMPALHGWGTGARAMASCSGIVPVVLVVDGPAVSGPALLLGLADLVVMTEGSYAFVSGPAMVAEFTGLRIDNEALGGVAAHARHTGIPAAVATDLEHALRVAADLLSFLPDHVDAEAAFVETDDPAERLCPELTSIVPATPTGSYDVRRVVEAVSDDGVLVELKARWAPNLVTGFASLGGRPIGVVANQPLAIAGTLDIPAAQKGAWFVALCDAFNLPLVTFVDTPGYYPGKDLEWRGMIRHGAQMAFAYAEASVPRVCVVIRKAYGGAYIVMDCKTMGNDICVAWPTAEVAVMGAKGAVQILYRRGTDEERLAREQEYGEAFLNPYVAAERGFIDAVIEPEQTRKVVADALDILSSKRESLRGRAHANTPL